MLVDIRTEFSVSTTAQANQDGLERALFAAALHLVAGQQRNALFLGSSPSRSRGLGTEACLSKALICLALPPLLMVLAVRPTTGAATSRCVGYS